jgi:adenosylcobinamide-GDP ribazoletransferase
MSAFLLALGFLTRVPVPQRGTLSAGALARSALWFPLVGALVGAVLGGTRLASELVLPPASATVIALAAAILLTAGLHEDGLADTADGFGALATRERRLETMRDPRVGTLGVLALSLALLLSVALLASLPAEDCLRAAVAGHALGRWSMLVHAATTPPARPDGAGRLLRVSAPSVAAATLLAAGLAVAALGLRPAAVATAAALSVTAAMGLLASSSTVFAAVARSATG